jgi:aldehyde dehydrogenase (NAD+)
MAPAIAMGNRVILSASEPFPLIATDFFQVLDTSDVPAGVVNILTGPHSEVAKTMAEHMNIDAVWSFSGSDLSQVIEAGSQTNTKRTWVNNGQDRDWFGPQGYGKEFLIAATEVKNIWIPYGE